MERLTESVQNYIIIFNPVHLKNVIKMAVKINLMIHL